jgi:mono/diheme cytochrome c family protein
MTFKELLPLIFLSSTALVAANGPQQIEQSCIDCHDKETHKGGLDLTALKFDLADRVTRERWVQIHDRVKKGEMPPKAEDMPVAERDALVKSLDAALYDADQADVLAHGRGPMRRLNRDEYEQNLRDVLLLPDLDIRDILPEDR